MCSSIRSINAYLDDILIFSRSRAEHTEHVRAVLRRLLDHQLFVKAEKCEFSYASTNSLEHIMSTGSISMDPEKVKAVVEWPTLECHKELQRFLGFGNFSRRFIRNYSSLAASLTALTSIKVPFIWSTRAAFIFKTFKVRFTSAPILVHPDLGEQFIIEVDTSVRPGFNIKYNIRTLFVEQKKFCGVSAHTWPVTFQASKYWSVTVNWLTVCWVRGHKAIRPAGKILNLLEYTPGRTMQTNDYARCAGPVTSGDDIRSAECIFWIIQNLNYIWTIC